MIQFYYKKVCFLLILCGVYHLKADPIKKIPQIQYSHPLDIFAEYSKLSVMIQRHILFIENDFEGLNSRLRYSRDVVENKILRKEFQIIFQTLKEQLEQIHQYVLHMSFSGIHISSELHLKLNHLKINSEYIEINLDEDLDHLISIGHNFFLMQSWGIARLIEQIQQSYIEKINKYLDTAHIEHPPRRD